MYPCVYAQINTFTPIIDQDIISLHNIDTISSMVLMDPVIPYQILGTFLMNQTMRFIMLVYIKVRR